MWKGNRGNLPASYLGSVEAVGREVCGGQGKGERREAFLYFTYFYLLLMGGLWKELSFRNRSVSRNTS